MANRDVGNTHQGMRPHHISATRFIVRKLQLHGSFFCKAHQRWIKCEFYKTRDNSQIFLKYMFNIYQFSLGNSSV